MNVVTIDDRISPDGIIETYDYDRFNFKPFNRDVSRSHVEKLKRLISEHGYIRREYIRVNEDLEIEDGQHRYMACRELGLPILYKVEPISPEEMISINSGRLNWTFADYLKFYAERGYDDYVRFRDFINKYGLTCHTGLRVIKSGGRERINEAFRSGTFKFTHELELRGMTAAIRLQSFKEYTDEWNTSVFISAVIYLLDHPQYNHERMLQKLALQPTALTRCAKRDQYIRQLEEIYNYRARSNDRVAFLR